MKKIKKSNPMEDYFEGISVIMPVYNREQSIVKAVDSVLSQTFQNFELVIVDDCSTDNTFKVIASISDPRIKTFKLKRNSGAAAARNHGIIKSYGRLISFLDSDDTYEKDFLKISFNTLESSPNNVGFMWTGSSIYHANKIEEQIWNPKRKLNSYHTFLNELKIGTGAGITIKREVFEKCGYFDERLPAAEDTEFFLRITQHYDFDFAPIPLINIFREKDDRMSKNFKNIATAYNIFLPIHFLEINKNNLLKQKFYYKLMWLNYHIKNKKLARQYFKRIPLTNFKKFSKSLLVFLIYELLPLKSASKIHLKLSN